MTKQEKIQEAYGNRYDKYLPDEYGWSTKIVYEWNEVIDGDFVTRAVGHGMYKVRPSSLQGIEDNNGWKIIKNGNSITLPEYKKGDLYEVYNMKTDSSYPCRFTAKGVKELFDCHNITHYRFLEISKKPIY